MEKDLFDYLVYPTKRELRKLNCIDKLYPLPTLKISKNAFLNKEIRIDYLVGDAIVNYNNEIVVAKYYCCSAIKYQEYFIRTTDDNYEFWSKKHLELTIKELFSIYDKSYHIINYMYDLQVPIDKFFKQNVRERLKEENKEVYKKVNKIYSKLFSSEKYNGVRDNITHNSSNLFKRYEPVYSEGKTSWEFKLDMKFEEAAKLIEEICEILKENKEMLIQLLMEKYPSKGE